MADDLPFVDPERLERALSSLSPTEREVLVLCARDGLRTDEIATRFQISAARAERLLAKAVAALDRALDRRHRP